MQKKEYINAVSGGALMTRDQEMGILLASLELLADAEPIFLKDGKWNPLKATSFARWIKLGRLAYKFIVLIVKIKNRGR